MVVLPIVAYELDLGDEQSWRPLRVWIHEALSQPYRAVVDAVCEARSVDTDRLLGASASLTLARGELTARRVFGIVEEINYLGFVDHRLAIRVHLVPAFALLQQRINSAIWQGQSAEAIITELLDAALPSYGRGYDWGQVSRAQAERELCVQYRESELAFVSRLLEDEGVAYEFVPDPDAGCEVLTLRDANSQYASLLNVDDRDEFPIVADNPREVQLESIQHLEWTRSLTSTAAALNEHDWMRPRAPLEAAARGQDERGRVREVYAHNTRRFLADDLALRSEDLRDAAALAGRVARGTSNITGLRPGLKIKVDGHDREDLEREYLITEVTHRGGTPDISGELGLAGGSNYDNEFECVPIDAVVRPRGETPRPRIHGPQTAIVTGEPGEEISTDEHGRIKLQFHWQRERAYDDSSSCWVRCAQSWAGLRWGAQFIPRVGMEVVVEFLDGDPDRPLVTGCVYNGDNPPPFVLPDNKTQSGILTQSSPGGDGFNALRFEDAKQRERVDLRAQRDLIVHALNDDWWTIGRNEAREIGNDRRDRVGHDETREIGNDRRQRVVNNDSYEVGKLQTVTVGGDRNEQIKGALTQEVVGAVQIKVGEARAVEVGGDQSLVVRGSLDDRISGDRSLAVTGDDGVTITGDHSLAAANIEAAAKAKLALEAGGAAKLSAGAGLELSAQADLALTSQAQASLDGVSKVLIRCGAASIVLESSGDITLKGTNIKLDALGTLTSKGGSISNN